MGTATGFDVEVAGDLGAVDEERWDALAVDSTVYLSSGWLRAVERMPPPARPAYVVVRDGAGRMVAAIPCYDQAGDWNSRYDLAHVLPGLTDRWPRHTLLGGTRRGYHNACAVAGGLGPDDRRRAVSAAAEGVQRVAEEVGADAVAWLYLPGRAAADLATAIDTVPALLTVDTVLDLPGASMEDYWASLPAGRRGRLRREATTFGLSSYAVAVERLTDCCEEAAPLLGQVQRRYGRPADDDLMLASLRAQAEHVDGLSRVFTCRRGGSLVGLALFYEWGSGLYGRLVGFDYPRLEDCCEYFNLAVYEPAAYAYARGLRFLHLGLTAYEAKGWRGARAIPLWGCLAARGWESFTTDDARRWNRACREEWLARLCRAPRMTEGGEWHDREWM